MDVEGEVLNVGGGSRTTINGLLAAIEEIGGASIRRRHHPATPGDQRHVGASITRARQDLEWEPRVSLAKGLVAQWTWYLAQVVRDAESRAVAV